MFTVNVHNNQYQVELDKSNIKQGTINGEAFNLDVLQTTTGSYHILHNNKSYNIDVVSADYAQKKLVLKINGNKYNVEIKEDMDMLLKRLGLENYGERKINEIKAPMPGMVIDIRVHEGSMVHKGDTLLVLEAMKMENNIKSAGDGKVKTVHCIKGKAVEKGQVLITFE